MSVFSKSSLATNSSFLFGSFKRSSSNVPVPKVNISALIKKKANLYWDETLSASFDGLLDSGYNLVLSKKYERDQLK